MKKLIAKLQQKSAVIITDKHESWDVAITRSPNLLFEVVIPHAVLEWFVTAKNTASGKEIWSDWVDYYHTSRDKSDDLQSQMRDDIERFIEHLLTSELRIVESRKFFAERQKIEWNPNGRWEKLSLGIIK